MSSSDAFNAIAAQLAEPRGFKVRKMRALLEDAPDGLAPETLARMAGVRVDQLTGILRRDLETRTIVRYKGRLRLTKDRGERVKAAIHLLKEHGFTITRTGALTYG